MKVFVAGASGAIGRPLIRHLIEAGHTVTGMTRSETAAQQLAELGAKAVRVDAFDYTEVEAALRSSGAEAVIDELTSLPKRMAQMPEAAAGDRKLRLEGGGNLYRASLACGVQRYLQQASAFFLAPGEGVGDESTGLAVDATPGVAGSARNYAELEKRVLAPGPMEGTALRYGFFYGPGTWYHPSEDAADLVRRQELPVLGEGQGMWNWIHIDDAAEATVKALTAPPGVYHITGDHPSPTGEWLPAFAKAMGAPEPPHISVEQALAAAGEDTVYYNTRLRGASNKKAREVLHWKPRPLEWLKS